MTSQYRTCHIDEIMTSQYRTCHIDAIMTSQYIVHVILTRLWRHNIVHVILTQLWRHNILYMTTSLINRQLYYYIVTIVIKCQLLWRYIHDDVTCPSPGPMWPRTTCRYVRGEMWPAAGLWRHRRRWSVECTWGCGRWRRTTESAADNSTACAWNSEIVRELRPWSALESWTWLWL